MERQYKYRSRYTANWDRIPKVEGAILERGVQNINGRKAHFLKVQAEDGEVTVFESAGLADLFKVAEIGDTVSIEYLGTVQTQAGRDFRQFRSSVWTEGDAAASAKRTVRRGRKPREPRTARRAKSAE